MRLHTRLAFPIFAALAVAVLPIICAMADDGLARGVAYLVSTQSPEGWWNPEAARRPVDTMEAFLALSRAGGDMDTMGRAIGYLASLEADDNENLALRLRALSHSTADTSEAARTLTARQMPDGGWGLEGARLGAVQDTVLAVLALLDSGKASPGSLSSAGQFLLNAQRTDGSWTFTEERSLSDTVHTAIVLEALLALKGAGYVTGNQANDAVAHAKEYLEDTGCLSGTGNLLDVAWCYLALASLKQPAELQASLALIAGAQRSDGSWNGLAYDTAVCLRALAAVRPPAEPLPDLSVSDTSIVFSPAFPLSGESVRVSATIFNVGTTASPSFLVSFYNRDPRLGGEALAPPVALPSVPAGGSAVASADFSTAGMAGQQQIVVFIDRQGTVSESSRANNAAARILTVGGIPDLAVSASEITLSSAPSAFEAVELSVTIRNHGNGEAKGVPVQIDDGDRNLVSQTLAFIAPGGNVRLVVASAFPAGDHSVRVSVDPEHSLVEEQVLSNNTATLSFSVPAPPVAPPDIAVTALSCIPSSPVAGETCAATATVDNVGGTPASAFDVTLHLDGVIVGTLSVPGLSAGGRTMLEFAGLTLTPGPHLLRVEADAALAVPSDANRTNNTLEANIHAASEGSPAELELVAIVAAPSMSDAATPVTFTAAIRNNGAVAALAAPLRFMVNGEPVGDDLRLPSLPGGGMAEAAFLHSFSAKGSFAVSIAIDPDETTPDTDRENNMKSLEYSVSGSTALAISSADIGFPLEPPTAFSEFLVSATIRNRGTLDATGVPVRFLDNGREMTTLTLGLVPAGGSARALLTVALPAGNHDITVSVDPDRALPDEHDYSDNSCTRTMAVLPDSVGAFALSAATPKLLPASPAAGEAVTVLAAVTNRGGEDAPAPFRVELRDGVAVLASFNIQQLPAGGRAEFQVQTALATGIHDISVVADPDGVTGDLDVSDNTATLQVDIPADATPPDLLIESLAVSPPTPSAGDQGVFTVTVKNVGTTTAGPFGITLSLDEVNIATWRVSGLSGGGSITLQAHHGFRNAGGFSALATADSAEEVAETDEENNARTLAVTVTDTPRPDLTLPPEGVTLSPSRPQPGVAFTALVTVANHGAEASPACHLVATPSNGGSVLAGADIPPLAIGASVVVSLNLALEAGDEGFLLKADAHDEVPESDEWNNSLSVPAAPAPLPDLLLEAQGISFSHNDLSLGTTVAIRVLVSNVGTAASPAGTVSVARSSGEVAAAIGAVALPALSPGASQEVVVLWNAVPGNHTVIAAAELPDGASEADDSNNMAMRTMSFTGVVPALIRLLDVPLDGSVGVPRDVFGAFEDIEIELTHHWGEACKPYLFVIDSSGGVYSVTRSEGKYYWNTGNAIPGDYRVRLTILSIETAMEVIHGVATSVGILLEECFLPFRIEESGTLRVLRQRSNPAFSVAGETTIINTSAELLNQSNTDRALVAIQRLKSPDGEVLATRAVEVAAGRRDSRLALAFAPMEWTFATAGAYMLELELTEDGETIAADTHDFPILGATAGIRALRRVEPETISTGGTHRVKVTVELEGVAAIHSGE